MSPFLELDTHVVETPAHDRFAPGRPRWCGTCGVSVEKHRVKCVKCVEHARFMKAEKLSEEDWAGPVYDDSRDEFFESIDSLRDSYAVQEFLELPLYVWACTVKPLALDLSRALSAQHEDHHDEGPGSDHGH